MPGLIKAHRHFDKGVQWALAPRGISIDGAAGLERILERGRGCILLGSHLGSFEALRALGRRAVRVVPKNVATRAGG